MVGGEHEQILTRLFLTCRSCGWWSRSYSCSFTSCLAIPFFRCWARARRPPISILCGISMDSINPLHKQYLHYWNGVVHGNLGDSIRLHDTVAHLVAQRYPYTLALTLAALALGLGSGVACGRYRGSATRTVARSVTLSREPVRIVGAWPRARSGAHPGIFNHVWLAAGFRSKQRWRQIDRLALSRAACNCDGRVFGGDLTRMVRTAMLEELGQDYICTARAKGLSEPAVVWRHALPNALVPIVTVVGLQFGALLAGAIVTEKIFSWPGLGRLVVDAISNRDYALVQGCLLSIGLTYVLVNLLTDVVYRWVNPRMRA